MKELIGLLLLLTTLLIEYFYFSINKNKDIIEYNDESYFCENFDTGMKKLEEYKKSLSKEKNKEIDESKKLLIQLSTNLNSKDNYVIKKKKNLEKLKLLKISKKEGLENIINNYYNLKKENILKTEMAFDEINGTNQITFSFVDIIQFKKAKNEKSVTLKNEFKNKLLEDDKKNIINFILSVSKHINNQFDMKSFTIEGHSSSEWYNCYENDDCRWKKNLILSKKRAEEFNELFEKSILNYDFRIIKIGKSYSEMITDKFGIEDKIKTRRVIIKIVFI